MINRRKLLKLSLVAPLGSGLNLLGCSNSYSYVDIRDFGANDTTDNYVAINEAIYAAGPGGAVYIPNGIWPVTLDDGELWQSIRLPSDITLFGDGEASILKLTGAVYNRASVLMGEDANNIALASFVIDCSYLGFRSSNVDARVNGVTLKGCNSCSMSNLSIIDGYGYGIWIWGGGSNSITKCRLRNFEDNIELTDSDNNIVDDNWVYVQEESLRKFEYDGASANSGILLYAGSSNNSIRNNIILGSDIGAGISTYSPYKDDNGKDPFDNIFSENIVNVTGYGLIVAGDRNSYINNKVECIGYPALAVWDDSFTNSLYIADCTLSSSFPVAGSGTYWNPYAIYTRGYLLGATFLRNLILSPDEGGVLLKGENIIFDDTNRIEALKDMLVLN